MRKPALLLALLAMTAPAQAQHRSRARESGIVIGVLPTGPLYAIFMEWPERESAIASLGTRMLPDAVIEKVELLGGPPLAFRRNGDALQLTLPPAQAAFTPAIRILGRGLV